MKKYIIRGTIILFYFICLGNQVKAQNYLFGKVLSEKSLLPLSDVLIEYQRNNQTQTIRTSSDGIFKIDLNGTTRDSKIKIKATGKESRTLNISKAIQNEFLQILLKDRGQTSVTASHWEQSVNEIPSSIVVIEREEIENLGYTSLQEVIENIPGFFTLDHRTDADVSIGIRGFCGTYNRHVMIQVNGVNMLSEFQNDFPLNKINISVESIDKIEVIRGPVSVIYGTGAFFGVINIITNELEGYSNNRVSSGIGTQNTNRHFFRYGLNKEGLKLSLNANIYSRNGFEESWIDMMGQNVFNQYQDSIYNQGNIVYPYWNSPLINKDRYSKSHRGLNFSVDYEGFFSNINYAQSNMGISNSDPGPKNRNPYISNSLSGEFGYRSSINGDRMSFEIKSAYNRSTVSEDFHRQNISAFSLGSNLGSSIRSQLNTRTTLLNTENSSLFNLDMLIGLSHNLNLQNQSTFHTTEDEIAYIEQGLSPNTNLNTIAAYVQLDFKWDLETAKRNFGAVQFVAGGRLEKQLKYSMYHKVNEDLSDNSYYISYDTLITGYYVNGDPILLIVPNDTVFFTPENFISDINDQNELVNFIPRLAFIYSFKKKNKTNHFIRAMFNEAIKQSSVNDNIELLLNIEPGLNASYLLPEKIKSLEFGYTIKNENKKIEASLNYFKNRLSNLILTTSIKGQGKETISIPQNRGVLETIGIEFIGRKWWVKKTSQDKFIKINTSINASYQITLNNDETLSPSFSPNLIGGAKFIFNYGSFSTRIINIRSISLGIHTNYIGGMNPGIAIDNDIEEYVGNASKPYSVTSANVRINGMKFKGNTNSNNASGFFLNLKASNVFNSKYFYPTTSNVPWALNGVQGRGRSILLSIGYDF